MEMTFGAAQPGSFGGGRDGAADEERAVSQGRHQEPRCFRGLSARET
jgi:hypothetical protein